MRSPAGLLAHALATRPGARSSPRTAWWWYELTRTTPPPLLVGNRIRARRVPGATRSGWTSAGPLPQRGPWWPSTCWRSVPPEKTLIAWKPRQMPRTGESSRLGHLPRLGLERVAIDLDRRRAPAGSPVALRVEVRSAADEESVHRRERLAPLAGGARRVEADRRPTLSADRGGVEGVAPFGEIGLGLASRDRDRHDDPRSGGFGVGHRPTIPPVSPRRTPRAPRPPRPPAAADSSTSSASSRRPRRPRSPPVPR